VEAGWYLVGMVISFGGDGAPLIWFYLVVGILLARYWCTLSWIFLVVTRVGSLGCYCLELDIYLVVAWLSWIYLVEFNLYLSLLALISIWWLLGLNSICWFLYGSCVFKRRKNEETDTVRQDILVKWKGSIGGVVYNLPIALAIFFFTVPTSL